MIDYAKLLKRAVVSPTYANAVRLRGSIVLVTGAGGSIGSELCRQIAPLASSLVLFDRAEDNLFRIHRELPEAIPCIGDVCDRARIETVFAAHRPDVVVHAAAYKHVPMMEDNAGEAVRNNVGGTRAVADAASVFGVDRFVLVSTDKAVKPSSVMGATKKLAEMYVCALSERSRTHFVTVRFGNVLGSTGSVVPIFVDQIERGVPVTVTHPDMTRYFMTIPEACRLVLHAGTMRGRGSGDVYVLDMGEPIKIVELARELMKTLGREVPIEYTGIRPGEKLEERLSRDTLASTGCPGILVDNDTGRVRLEQVVSAIVAVSGAADVRAKLLEVVS